MTRNKLWKKTSDNTIAKLIVLFISVGIGSFICAILEHTEMNVWHAGGIGACVIIVAGFLCSLVVRKLGRNKDN